MGTTQVYGVDFFDTYASTINAKSLRILLSVWNNNPHTEMEHWDIKNAFVNAPIAEDIYVYQVRGFERDGTQGRVLKLKKALYGTKQAANAWQKHLSLHVSGSKEEQKG
jgi:hypothetical protein